VFASPECNFTALALPEPARQETTARLGTVEWRDCRHVHGKALKGSNRGLSEAQFRVPLEVMRKTMRILITIAGVLAGIRI
jgi:hypothetical protein